MKYNKLKNISTTKILNHDIHESNDNFTSTKDYKNHKSRLRKFKKERKKAIKEITSTFSTKEFKIIKHQTGSDVHSKKKPHNTYFKHHFNEKPFEYYTAPNYHKLNTHLKFTDEVTTTNISNESKYTEVNHLHLKNKKTNKKSKPAKKHTPNIHQCTECQEIFKNSRTLKIHNKQNHSRNQAQITTSHKKNKNEENNKKHNLLFKKKKKKKKKNRVCKNKNKDDTSEFQNIDLGSNSNAIPQIYTTPQKKVKNIKDNSCDSHHKKYLKNNTNNTVADYTKRRYHNEIFKCDDCEVSFDFLSALQNHKSSAHQEKKVASPNSITEISSKNDEKEPFLREKKVKKKKEKLLLDNQIKLTLKENKKLQRTSSSEVLSNNDLENDIDHEYKNKKDNYQIYRCEECRMSFALPSAFFKHNLKAHTLNNGIQSDISKCSENNNQESSLLLKKLPKQMENKNEKAFQKADPVLMSPNKTNMLELQSICDALRNKYLENDFDVKPDEIFIKIFYKCNICSMSFEDSYSLKEHKIRLHVIDESVVTESYTSTNSKDDYEYKQLLKQMGKKQKQKNGNTSTFLNDNHHAKSHAPTEKSTILPKEVMKCKISTTFDVHPEDILKSHVPTTFSEKSQSNENLNECNICSKKFSNKSSLKRHYLIHTGEKPYKCDVCEKLFRTKSQLMIHYRTHTGEKPYKCDVCDKLFATKFQLTIHYRIHTGEKPYKCDVCDQLFRTKCHLTVHYKRHTGEKPFVCNVCSGLFREKSTLKTHYRTHTDEKPYECDICGWLFREKSTLVTHYRTHTGEKPYECGLCEMAFISSTTRLKHIRSKHDR